jgi:hypothetical protein
MDQNYLHLQSAGWKEPASNPRAAPSSSSSEEALREGEHGSFTNDNSPQTYFPGSRCPGIVVCLFKTDCGSYIL